MLGYLWALTALSAVVASISLILGLLLARRYRELHSAFTDAFGPDGAGGFPEPGMTVPDFTATANDGERLGPLHLAGSNILMAFLSASCSPCEEELPALRDACAAVPDGHPTAIAVVTGEPERREAYVRSVQPYAHVVEGGTADELATAFGVRGFPCFVVAGQGELRQVGSRVDAIDASVRLHNARLESMS